MTVKVMLLKSGEDVITDAQEVRDKETDNIVAYHLMNPYVMQLTTVPVEPEGEITSEDDQPQVKISVSYTHWAPLSKQREFFLPADWVVTIYDPHDNIMVDYCKKHPPLEEQTPNEVTPTEVVGTVNEPETVTAN
jgi:hypothetical protein